MVSRGKWVSIIIAPHNRANSWNLKVPGWALWVFGAFCILGVAAMVACGFLYRQYRDKAQVVAILEAENRGLMETTRRLKLLEEDLASLSQFNREVREWVGLPPDTTLLRSSAEAYEPLSMIKTPVAYGGSPLGGGWDWPTQGWISRGFSGGSGKEPGHDGLDIVGGKNEPVRAARAGRVTFCGWDDRLGNLITIDHGDGYVSWYGHNAELLVSEGDSVARGQKIGVIGSTGVSSAPHLHFEIRKNGQPTDPLLVLTGE